MKLRTIAFLAITAFVLTSFISGSLPLQAAALLLFLSGASLVSYRDHARLACACPSPFEAIPIATESLSQDIFRKASWRSPWFSYIQRGVFPKNKGLTQTDFIIGNSEPTSSAETWTELSLASNVISPVCSSSYTDVDVGYNARTYKPRRIGLAGPVICRETLSFAHEPVKFMEQYFRELTKRAKRTWELEFQNTYIATADKMVARPGLTVTSGASTFPQIAPTSQLTQDILDTAILTLMEAGATDADEDMIELGADGPIFPVIIGVDAIQKLLTNVTTRRDDLRYADMGKGPQAELMKRLGATRVLRNARIIPDLLPPRYDFTPGVGYSRVATWEMVAGTEGTVAQLTAAYKNALYEVAVILHPKVLMAEIVSPESAGLAFDPMNYAGEWIWKTGGDISTTYCFDPLKHYGRHFAEFMYAPRSLYPNFGMSIMFKRCAGDQNFAACAS